MRRLRSNLGLRLITGWLLACLLASVFVTSVRGGQQPVGPTYATWLRAQLRVPADAALEQAFKDAAAAEAQTLEGYLIAFVAAYEARQPQAPLAPAFSSHDLSNDALIGYLESCFQGVGGEALPARGTYLSATVPLAKTPDRLHSDGVVVAVQALRVQRPFFGVRAACETPAVPPVRVRSSARPLGP